MTEQRRSDQLADVLTEAELAYLSRAVFRHRIDVPDDEPELAASLDPLISVARIAVERGTATPEPHPNAPFPNPYPANTEAWHTFERRWADEARITAEKQRAATQEPNA